MPNVQYCNGTPDGGQQIVEKAGKSWKENDLH